MAVGVDCVSLLPATIRLIDTLFAVVCAVALALTSPPLALISVSVPSPP